MLITYCSNDNSAKYGPTVFAVEAGRLPHESIEEANALYAHVAQVEVEPDNVWGCPTALVMDIVDGQITVRPKGEAEALVDNRKLANEAVYAQIRELEATQTPRRLRDAALTEDGRVWLVELEAKIHALRLSMSV